MACLHCIARYSYHIIFITYCIEIWGNTYASNTRCLFILQKKAIRVLYGVDRLSHTTSIFKELSILKFQDLVRYQTAIVMYNLYRHVLPSQLQSRFTRYVKPINTR